MEHIKIKIKEVYLPFLLASIGTILFYNVFRWTFDIQLGILPLKDDLLNYWIPFALPWIPIVIWLRRRLRILNVKGKRDDGHFLYQLAMAFAIAAPLIVSQNYIAKGSFDLIEIDSVSDVNKFTNEKYFKIASYKVNHRSSLPYVTSRTSGKRNEKLNFYLYFSCPFDQANGIWYGIIFNKYLSNGLSDTQKQSEYRSFLKNSEREFKSYSFYNVNYFEKVGYSDERDGFMNAIKEKYPQTKEKQQIILMPKYDVFDERLGTTFPWIFGSFGIGAFILLVMVVIPKIDQKELTNFKKGQPLKDDYLQFILQFLDPRGPFPVTSILLLLNIMVFVVMLFSGLNIISPTTRELLDIGGNRRFEVLNGEYWRLMTSMFIHSGVMHLIMNLFGLGLGAVLLEGILGRTKLLLSYMACGLLASLASIYWHDNTISVGASGAIFGLYGLILAFTVFKIYASETRSLTWILLGSYAGISLLLGFFGGSDNAAHIGGLLSGFVIGGLFILLDKEQLQKNAN